MENLPKVSIATPTFNRRPFIPYLIKSIENQDYPKDKIEWVIVDDGTDKIKDLVCNLDYVKYYEYEEKLPLGKKRNIMNSKCSGDIIVYFDDDDYYPMERIRHAVEELINSNFLVAGSSKMHIYYKDIDKMYSFGPFGSFHSTAATLAFKRELLDLTSFNDDDCIAEEKAFLKNYKIPLLQLNSIKTILVFRHIHNSYDKNDLLKEDVRTIKELTTLTPVDFFKQNTELQDFYTTKNIDDALIDYDAGKLKNKPDVIKQMESLKKQREKMMKQMNNETPKTTSLQQTQEQKMISVDEYNNMKNSYEKAIQQKSLLIDKLLLKIRQLQEATKK